jgi:hypothetical protein
LYTQAYNRARAVCRHQTAVVPINKLPQDLDITTLTAIAIAAAKAMKCLEFTLSQQGHKTIEESSSNATPRK